MRRGGDTSQSEDGGTERRGGVVRFVVMVGLRWDRGENKVVRIGKLPAVICGRADEIAANPDRVFFGIRIHDRDPEFSVGGAGVGAVRWCNVYVCNWAAFRIDEGSGGWVRGVEMPCADQRRRGAGHGLLMSPTDGDEDRLNDQKSNGENNFGNEYSDAPGAAGEERNPWGSGCGGLVAPEKAVEGARVRGARERCS